MAEHVFSLPGKEVAVDVKNAENGDGTAMVQRITTADGTTHHLLICGCKDDNDQWHTVAKSCPPTHDVVCDCTDPRHPKAFCARS